MTYHITDAFSFASFISLRQTKKRSALKTATFLRLIRQLSKAAP